MKKKVLYLIIIIFNAGLSQAQHLYLGGQIDIASVSITPEISLNDNYRVGSVLKIGYSKNLSYTIPGNEIMWFNEHFTYGGFVQKLIREDCNIWGKSKHKPGDIVISILPRIKWVWELGFRTGYVTVEDDNPKHGFSHVETIHAYLALRRAINLYSQIGVEIGGGYNGIGMIYIGGLHYRMQFYTI